ncbi:MAG: cytochrome c, partial [Aldersonia sp.]|nr:cytochrome c [Aldersonia sp.]
MRRVSLVLSLSAATVVGAMVGAQDPEHAPPPRPQGAAGAVAPAAPQDAAPAQPSGRGRGGAAPGAGRGRGRSFDEAAIARARPVFESQCGFCHGNDARGRAGGPDLARSLVVLGDTGGKELAGFIRTGRPERGMPAFPGLSDQQIADIAEFLHERLEAARSRAATDTMLSLVG